MTATAFIRDAYLGARGSALRGLVPLVKADGRPALAPGDARRILFIRIDRVGDLVLSTPALKAIKSAFPGSELTVLASPGACGILDNNPHVDRVVVYDRTASMAARAAVLRGLREGRYDLAVDPLDDWDLEPALIAAWSAAPVRIGYAGAGREVFFNRILERPRIPAPAVDVALRVLQPLGIRTADRKPQIALLEQEKAQAGQWLAERLNGGAPVVGIHPGATYGTQRWMPDYFVELADRLAKEGAAVMLLGGPSDGALVERIAGRMRSRSAIRVVAGNLRRFCALLWHCRLLVCNNSGPLHVACSLDVPTVSFMGPTVMERWYPAGEGHTVLRKGNLPCIGCNSGRCRVGTHDCMRLITPSDAFESVCRVLMARGPSRSTSTDNREPAG